MNLGEADTNMQYIIICFQHLNSDQFQFAFCFMMSKDFTRLCTSHSPPYSDTYSVRGSYAPSNPHATQFSKTDISVQGVKRISLWKFLVYVRVQAPGYLSRCFLSRLLSLFSPLGNAIRGILNLSLLLMETGYLISRLSLNRWWLKRGCLVFLWSPNSSHMSGDSSTYWSLSSWKFYCIVDFIIPLNIFNILIFIVLYYLFCASC